MLELETYSFMKIFLNPELQVISSSERVHAYSPCTPFLLIHSDGALQNLQSAFMHFASLSFKVTYESDK